MMHKGGKMVVITVDHTDLFVFILFGFSPIPLAMLASSPLSRALKGASQAQLV